MTIRGLNTLPPPPSDAATGSNKANCIPELLQARHSRARPGREGGVRLDEAGREAGRGRDGGRLGEAGAEGGRLGGGREAGRGRGRGRERGWARQGRREGGWARQGRREAQGWEGRW